MLDDHEIGKLEPAFERAGRNPPVQIAAGVRVIALAAADDQLVVLSDIAVFPLAFPLIAGPGSLSATVLVMGRTIGWLEGAAVIAMLLVCLVLTLLAMRAAERLSLLLGRTGADVVSRISGILLVGRAVQFVFDGLAQAPFLAG